MMINIAAVTHGSRALLYYFNMLLLAFIITFIIAFSSSLYLIIFLNSSGIAGHYHLLL